MPHGHDDDHPNGQVPEDDSRSDASSDLEELYPHEFPRYFVERDGRLFHSHVSSPYPLPVDAYEQHRQNRQHYLLRQVVEANYANLVRHALRNLPGEQRHVVDLCTGTGKWVMDLAADYPHARIDGLDIVPIQTRHPLKNVFFEMHDVTERFRYGDRTIDFVHARDISYAVRTSDFPALIREVARILRPGGLFMSGEWESDPIMSNGQHLDTAAPDTFVFFREVKNALRTCGLASAADGIPQWLRASGFRDLAIHQFRMTNDEQTGRRFVMIVTTYAESMQLWLVKGGHLSHARARELVRGMLREVDSLPGIVFTYRVVHARAI
ncbi:S-adenosyl-L-methionine-dependent methyltransferase [Laetiporus sulphureus 93-53]|uniref:S-adenosyl-L-methionine-dependent methyltransferase n=1 Tax=Laetiporus sulphureus 93-53 TaxID=1314785 RepID=A0A165BXK5_9APHY|nr:S-adenosyl-L-methionine-dependent methyltransferase [Laetiporus sulphureus 93-53]KZT01838.1 S-adenosyl-L-methionine-dependent methyltransferase [Laetiporus sulphureus 93-53]